jgi:FKBP-type peptidyl-prolyl cis-trans isomerase
LLITSLWMLLAACSGSDTAKTDEATKGEQTELATAKAEGPGKAKAQKEIPPPEDVASAPSDAQKTDSGVAYKVLTQGTGTEKPSAFSRVTVKYTAWTPDGKMVETTEGRGRVSNFGLQEAPLPFLKDVLPNLVQGSKARYWVPGELAYKGKAGKPEGPVTVDVELATVVNPPSAPEDVAAPPADATKTASGLAYKVLKAGTSEDTPSRWARVTVNFTGWKPDGTLVDSTVARGRPQMLKLTDKAMPGWIEAVTLMHRGEKIRAWIPEKLTENGPAGTPSGMLVYDIELLSFDNPIPPPEDVAAAPADAQKTSSGLAYKVLKKGSGGAKPTASSVVEVHYTGWTTDGGMFDSSIKRNKPMRFAASQVIPGWTEGLQLMTVGEKTRFWVPKELAYNDQPGKPAGMLVFDVELLSFSEGPQVPPDLTTPAADGIKTPSGVTVKILKKGSGKDKPVEGAKVQVHYTGWAQDGKMFDSTAVRGEPANFPLGGAVPKGLVEGIQQLGKGDKARLWIPEEAAQSSRPGGPKGTLVFDVELVSFDNPPPPIPAPADVAAPPADTTKTASGLAYKVLKKGTGTVHPTATDKVKVHYTGWTTDGKMFDSSEQRGEPATFGVSGVIKGWTEGLQLMTVGERTRLWIPVELAYQNRPGKPEGMLVFDVELLEILDPGAAPQIKLPSKGEKLVRPPGQGAPPNHP